MTYTCLVLFFCYQFVSMGIELYKSIFFSSRPFRIPVIYYTPALITTNSFIDNCYFVRAHYRFQISIFSSGEPPIRDYPTYQLIEIRNARHSEIKCIRPIINIAVPVATYTHDTHKITSSQCCNSIERQQL